MKGTRLTEKIIQNLLYHKNHSQNKKTFILNSRSKTTNPTNNSNKTQKQEKPLGSMQKTIKATAVASRASYYFKNKLT